MAHGVTPVGVGTGGHVYQDLFRQLKPKTFVDPMMGSGTSIEVAKEMGIIATGLDLHQGFNAVTDSILNRVGYQSDLVLSHPPYGHDHLLWKCVGFCTPG